MATGTMSPTRTSTHTLQAYDSNTGKVIYVQPGVYTPGASLTKPANISNPAGKIDPFAVAAKYGYTAQDFANDPNFASYWSTQNEAALTRALSQRSDFDKSSNKKMTTQKKDNTSLIDTPEITGNAADTAEKQKENEIIQALFGDIDKMDLAGEQKAILKNIAVGNYVSGQKIPSAAEISKIIEDAATNAAANLNPYFDKVNQQELEDVKRNLATIRDASARYAQREEQSYNKKLAETKQSLRARGLTFSGSSLKTLGSESALKNTTGIEGELPTERRLNYEEQTANWRDKAAEIGINAERNLGSAQMTGIDWGNLTTPYGNQRVYDPTGNVSIGENELQRKKSIEKAKWDNVSAYRLYI